MSASAPYASFCLMRRTLFAAVLIALASAAQAVPQTAPQKQPPAATKSGTAPQRKIPCKVPENAAMCYWTRGRLNFYEGNPAYRIWKVGTKRILAVYSGPAAFPPRSAEDFETPEFPTNLDGVFSAESQRRRKLNEFAPYLIGADFEVCPLEPERAGQMQAVCIESAKNIFVEMSRRLYH